VREGCANLVVVKAFVVRHRTTGVRGRRASTDAAIGCREPLTVQEFGRRRATRRSAAACETSGPDLSGSMPTPGPALLHRKL
jgi:hypothetical protein